MRGIRKTPLGTWFSNIKGIDWPQLRFEFFILFFEMVGFLLVSL